MNKYYKLHKPTGEVIESDSLSLLFSDYVITMEDVYDYFNECYGMVNTPMGEVSMGALMNSFLSDEDKIEFRLDYAEAVAYALTDDEWTTIDEKTDILEYEGFVIERISNDYNIEKINSICNKMEGEW